MKFFSLPVLALIATISLTACGSSPGLERGGQLSKASVVTGCLQTGITEPNSWGLSVAKDPSSPLREHNK